MMIGDDEQSSSVAGSFPLSPNIVGLIFPTVVLNQKWPSIAIAACSSIIGKFEPKDELPLLDLY